MKITLVMSLLIMLSWQWLIGISYADDAEVLPKGVSRVRIDNNFYLPIDKRYNSDGEVENVAVDYNTSLNSSVFPALAFFGPSASIGNSVVSFDYDFNILNLGIEYGISNRLSAGIIIPYWWVTNNVDASVNSSAATVGKSVLADSLVPLPFAGTPDEEPLTTENVQNILGNGLDINGDGDINVTGFGYKRVETSSDNGLSDMEAGFRYQYFKTDAWRLAFTGGARLPTGKIDDPDNLVDYARGDGTYDLLFRLNNDYTGIEKLVLDGTFRYDLQLPDREIKRVPADVNLPITANKEEVKRDLGDIFELETSAKYSFFDGFNTSMLYKYILKLKDEISGSQGFAYQSLEDETDITEHVLIVGLSYSTIPLFREKKFPFPLIGSISYRNRFAGSNNVLKSQYIALGLQAFF